MDKKLFASRLNFLLRQRKVTQQDLAIKIGIAQKNLNHWCTGKSLPRLDQYAKLCNILRVHAGWLLGLADFDDFSSIYLPQEDVDVVNLLVSALEKRHKAYLKERIKEERKHD